MKEETPWNIIARCFNNKATPNELEKLEDWLKDDYNNRLFNEAYLAFKTSGTVPGLLFPDKKLAWKKIGKQISRGKSAFIFFRLKYVAAAIIFMLLSLSVSWQISKIKLNALSKLETQIIAPPGQKSLILLPDSSLVWLNSGSTLSYSANFNHSDRQIKLSGEAFFKVHHDKSKRFTVKTGILDVNVYGTAFNIKNHDNDDFLEVTVNEGLVGLSNNKGEIRKLSVGEMATLDKNTNKIEFSQTNAEIINAWTDNELVFDNTRLEDVVKYLERWYGVTISIDNGMKGKHNYTFRIKTESLREMLEMMKVMTPLEYEINGKEVKIKYKN